MLLVMIAGAVSAQRVDVNSNGMSDIWEWLYGANGINPNADADGDGFSNQQEATAGTDPFNSNSIPKISTAVFTGTNGSITMPDALGKLYQLQSITNLGSTNWLVETSAVARAGTNITFPSSANAAMKFYRIVVSDVDTDGDGVNDWEEYQLGLDPSNAWSNAQLDGNGNPLGDYPYVTGRLATQNVITIAATDPTTMQPDPGQSPTDLGVFTVTRGGFPLNSITVNLGLGGPGAGFAAPDLDYIALPASVSLPAGTSSMTVSVTPLANINLLVPVIAQLKLLSGSGYTVGSMSNASVVIFPSATANGTGLAGQYFSNSSPTDSGSTNFNAPNLFLTRIDPVIDFTWTNGTSPNLSNGLYTVRWTGQVQPQYSELYFFDTVSDDAVNLWVTDQLLIDNC